MKFLKFVTVLILTVPLAYGQFCFEDFCCPEPEEISPCFCVRMQERVACGHGSYIQQSDVDKVIPAMRKANGVVNPDQPYYISRFEIIRTNLTTVDLSSLLNTQIYEFQILNNPQLESITVNEGPAHPQWGINGTKVQLYTNNLTDDGVAGILKHLVPNSASLIDLSSNQITGGQYLNEEGFMEFLPGLSRQRKVQTLYLGGNNIQSLSGGQFRRHQRMYYISLGSSVRELGKDAFLFDEHDEDMEDKLFQIGFSMNQMTDNDIHPQNGLVNTTRATRLMIIQNYYLETLTEEKFNFIFKQCPTCDANNKLILHYTYIYCDSRLKWMKDNRAILQSRVEGAWCANDQGKTVFDSDLIP